MEHHVWVRVQCTVDLPDDEAAAAQALDDFTTRLMLALAGAGIPGSGSTWVLEEFGTYWPGEVALL